MSHIDECVETDSILKGLHASAVGSSSLSRPFSKSRRGAALIEVALTLPILLLVLAMIGDFSRAYIVAKALDNAVSQAAIAASTTSIEGGNFTSWAAGIEQKARLSMGMYSWYVPTQLTVVVAQPSVSNGLVDSGGNVTAQIQAQYFSDHLIRLPGLSGSYTIERTLRIDKIR